MLQNRSDRSILQPQVPYSSIGDSVNNLSLKHTEEGLFAHVVTGNPHTLDLVRRALVKGGLPESAVNAVPLPDGYGLWDYWTHFETVMRMTGSRR